MYQGTASGAMLSASNPPIARLHPAVGSPCGGLLCPGLPQSSLKHSDFYLTLITSSVPEEERERDVGSWPEAVQPGHSGRLVKPPHA